MHWLMSTRHTCYLRKVPGKDALQDRTACKLCVLAQIVVVFMSLGFIGFVTVLHIIGKVRLHCLSYSCFTLVTVPPCRAANKRHLCQSRAKHITALTNVCTQPLWLPGLSYLCMCILITECKLQHMGTK